MYNLTQLQEAITPRLLFVYANDSTLGLFTGILLLAFFFVILLALKKQDFDDSLLVASFICFVLSVLLRSAELINFFFPLGFGTVMVFVGMYLFVIKRDN